MFVFMEENNCPICHSKDTKAIFEDTLIKCSSCQHGWANLKLDHEFLQNLYASNYFKGEEYADYLADKEILQLNFKKRLKKIVSQNPNLQSAIEIGCAYGFFYQNLQEVFPNINYQGFDISADAIDYATANYGPNFSANNFLETASQKKVDAIFMWDVIEHLSDPSAFLKKANTQCNKGAMIYLTTGDFGSLMSRVQGKKWRMIHPPTHLHYFTKKSIYRLLRQHGFEPIFIKYPTIHRSMGLIYYALFILNKKSSKFHSWLYGKIPSKAIIPFNSFDIFFIGAKKID